MDKARKGYEWWDKINAVQRYSFIIGADGGVRRVENTSGNWIEASEAQAVVDDAQAEINVLRERLERIAPATASQPPSASGERDVMEALDRMDALLDPKCGLLTVPDSSATVQASRRDLALIRSALAPSPGIDAAGQKPVADGETSAILQWIMKQAEAAKEPCGDDPESRAAVRNSKLAAIASAAAQALGMVCGPSYAAPPAAQPSAEQQPVAWLQQNIDRPVWFEIAAPNEKALTKDWTDAFPVFRQSADAQPSADDPQFPFYELRFIMRVLSHQGSAPKEDWQTAYGMARDIFVRWSKERQAAEPHPPSRACMCDACKPSFENGADDPAQRYDIVRQVAGPSAEWLAEAERLVSEHTRSTGSMLGCLAYGSPGFAQAKRKCNAAHAALLAHLRTKPSTEPWCDTMDRPKSKCGCPDCGPSLIDLGPGLRNTPGKP